MNNYDSREFSFSRISEYFDQPYSRTRIHFDIRECQKISDGLQHSFDRTTEDIAIDSRGVEEYDWLAIQLKLPGQTNQACVRSEAIPSG